LDFYAFFGFFIPRMQQKGAVNVKIMACWGKSGEGCIFFFACGRLQEPLNWDFRPDMHTYFCICAIPIVNIHETPHVPFHARAVK